MPAIGIPKHRHHIGKVVGRGVDGPVFPIEEPNALSAVRPGQKEIPCVRIAVNDCQVAARMIAREQARRRIEQSFVQIAPLGRYHFAITISEARELVHQTSQNPVPCSRVAPAAYRNTQARIVPPRGVDARQRLHDTLALRKRRRQRPLRGDEMGIRQVFEQQVPRAGIRSLDGLKAVRHQSRRQRRGNIAVERDLLPVRVRWMTGAVEMSHLEDQGRRGISCLPLIVQMQPPGERAQLWKRTYLRDVANVCRAKHAKLAQRGSEIIGVSYKRQGVRCH